MLILGAGACGCCREFCTPAIHPGAVARRAGSRCSAVPRRCRAHIPFLSSCGGYHSLQQGMGVLFQGLSWQHVYNL
jgi:hypothetical protein